MMKKLTLFAVLVLCLLMLTACGGADAENANSPQPTNDAAQISADGSGSEAEEEVHLVVVLGSHANAPAPNLALLEPYIYKVCRSYGSVTLIVDDGSPFADQTIDVPIQEGGLSEKKYTSIANEQTAAILARAAVLTAQTPEVDTLRAFQMAARELNAASTERPDVNILRQMVVLDSCLSTEGVLNFQNSDLNTLNAAEVTEQLSQLGELPVFEEPVEVILYSVGDVMVPQSSLTENARQNLRECWQTVLEAGGADVNLKDNLPTAGLNEGLPAVSVVDITTRFVNLNSRSSVNEAMETGTSIRLGEESIAFCSGSAELVDKAAAEAVLSNVIDYLLKTDETLLVVGTTAHWPERDLSYHQKLSQERAQTVADLLIDHGVSRDRLTVIGKGYSSHFYENDQTADGKLDNALAPRNRAVYLVTPQSEDGQKLLNN